METSFTDELIGRRLENFVVERLVGVGRMAHVYQARDLLLGREVAIKALSPMFLTDAGYVERFRREAQRVAALEHQNIAPMLQFIEVDRGLYVVMPLYVESLRELLDRKKRLSISEATRIVTEIGSALAVAHSHGLIHRDVKPGNILLDAEGKAALTDFGIARPARFNGNPDTLTLAGSGLPVGTPQYMPPEQLCGADLDQRADIYALGVVLYEMLTGQTPHVGNSPFEVAAAALTEPITPPSRLNPDITFPVEAVMLRALSMRATDRYANVISFVEALQGANQGSADSVTRPMLSPVWRGSRMAGQLQQPTDAAHRRGHGWWITVSLIALASILGIGGGFILLSSATGGQRPNGSTLRIQEGDLAATATASSQASATTSAIATATVVGRTSTPDGTPTGTTTPAPSATAALTPTVTPLPPPLSLSPILLHLQQDHANQCSGSQTISNSGAQRMTWQWSNIQPGAPSSFLYGVNTAAQFGGLPADLYPGVAPGGTDTLNVQMKCTGQSYTVTLRDGFGRTQQFTMTSD